MLAAQLRAVGGVEPHFHPDGIGIRNPEQVDRGDWKPVAGPYPCGVNHLYLVAQGGPQSVEWGDDMSREDGRAAATEGASDRGVRPEYRHLAHGVSIKRKQRALVAGEHETGCGGGPQLRTNLLIRPWRCGVYCRRDSIQSADARRQTQDAQHMAVDGGLGNRAGADGGDKRIAPRARRAGHDQVEQAVVCGSERPACVPVGHDDPVKTPFGLEHIAL